MERRKVKRFHLKERALIIDDDVDYAHHLKEVVNNLLHPRIITAVNTPIDAFRQVMSTQFDYIFVDIVFNGNPCGLKLPPRLARYNPNADIIMATSHPEYEAEIKEFITEGIVSAVWWKNASLKELSETANIIKTIVPVCRKLHYGRLELERICLNGKQRAVGTTTV